MEKRGCNKVLPLQHNFILFIYLRIIYSWQYTRKITVPLIWHGNLRQLSVSKIYLTVKKKINKKIMKYVIQKKVKKWKISLKKGWIAITLTLLALSHSISCPVINVLSSFQFLKISYCNSFVKRTFTLQLHFSIFLINQADVRTTAGKLSKYGVCSGRYFPVLGLNTKVYVVNLRIQPKYQKIRTRKNSVLGHFSRSESVGYRQRLLTLKLRS